MARNCGGIPSKPPTRHPMTSTFSHDFPNDLVHLTMPWAPQRSPPHRSEAELRFSTMEGRSMWRANKTGALWLVDEIVVNTAWSFKNLHPSSLGWPMKHTDITAPQPTPRSDMKHQFQHVLFDHLHLGWVFFISFHIGWMPTWHLTKPGAKIGKSPKANHQIFP